MNTRLNLQNIEEQNTLNDSVNENQRNLRHFTPEPGTSVNTRLYAPSVANLRSFRASPKGSFSGEFPFNKPSSHTPPHGSPSLKAHSIISGVKTPVQTRTPIFLPSLPEISLDSLMSTSPHKTTQSLTSSPEQPSSLKVFTTLRAIAEALYHQNLVTEAFYTVLCNAENHKDIVALIKEIQVALKPPHTPWYACFKGSPISPTMLHFADQIFALHSILHMPSMVKIFINNLEEKFALKPTTQHQNFVSISQVL